MERSIECFAAHICLAGSEEEDSDDLGAGSEYEASEAEFEEASDDEQDTADADNVSETGGYMWEEEEMYHSLCKDNVKNTLTSVCYRIQLNLAHQLQYSALFVFAEFSDTS